MPHLRRSSALEMAFVYEPSMNHVTRNIKLCHMLEGQAFIIYLFGNREDLLGQMLDSNTRF